MDAAEREKIRAMCAALMPQAKKPERPMPPKREKPKAVHISLGMHGRTSRAGPGSNGNQTRAANGRLIQKCPICAHRVEMPCRACHVRSLMEAGVAPPPAR